MKRLLLALAGLLVAAQAAFAGSGATYTVTFEGQWTAANHPREYPAHAHFSGLIGATHGTGYALFREGGIATDGLERLSEMGAHSPLDQEIRKAIEAGTAGALLTSGPLFDLPKSASITFAVDDKHPMVSVAAMIAKSRLRKFGPSSELRPRLPKCRVPEKQESANTRSGSPTPSGSSVFPQEALIIVLIHALPFPFEECPVFSIRAYLFAVESWHRMTCFRRQEVVVV